MRLMEVRGLGERNGWGRKGGEEGVNMDVESSLTTECGNLT